MPSNLPTDLTPSDADDFGISDAPFRSTGKGVDQAFLDAKPGSNPGPASQLPEGGEPIVLRTNRLSESELPTDPRVEETTSYGFGNSMNTYNTVVDMDAPWIFPNEATPKKAKVSGDIRGLAAFLRGEKNA